MAEGGRLFKIEEMKKAYFTARQGKHDLLVQTQHLNKLAKVYEYKYQESQDWRHCLQAHTLFNAVAVRDPDLRTDAIESAFGLQKDFWGPGKARQSTCTYKQSLDVSKGLLRQLGKIRDTARSQLSKAEKYIMGMDTTSCNHQTEDARSKFIGCVKDITLACTNRMLEFIHEIFQQSVLMITPKPPCDFIVVAIGSLARGDATPYSDLEYMFLVEKRTQATEQYFERLAMTSYFVIGNLQETRLGNMDIAELRGWFDDMSKSGIKIDGLKKEAGNIPTGNGYGAKNTFLLTPEDLLTRYKFELENPDIKHAEKGDITSMLTYQQCIFSHGSKIKLDDIRVKMGKERRNEKRKEANCRMLLADISKFNFNMDANLKWSGYTMDVKKQLYRFPSILTMDLAVIHGVAGKTSWETVKLLWQKSHISKSTKSCLEFLLASACYIRLSAYLFHDSQDDRVSVAPQKDLDNFSLNMKRKKLEPRSSYRRWYIPHRLFSNICMHMVPLKRRISTSDADVALKELKSFTARESHWTEVIQIQHFTGRHKEAYLKLLHTFPDLHITPGDVIKQISNNDCEEAPITKRDYIKTVLSVVADLLLRCSNYPGALRFYEYMYKERYSPCKFFIAECHVKSAVKMGGHNNIAENLIKGLTPFSAEDHYTIGWLHSFNPRSNSLAETHLVKSIQISHHTASTGAEKYASSETPYIDLSDKKPSERLHLIVNIDLNIINCMMVLGDVYKQRNAIKEARDYYRRSCDMISAFYGENVVVSSVAHVKQRRGVLYDEISQNDDERGIQYVRDALEIFEDTFDSDHTYVKMAKLDIETMQKRRAANRRGT